MASDKVCPVDGSALTEIGSHGITDCDGGWDAETTKYECAEGLHTIFVADSDAIVDPHDSLFDEAAASIEEALRSAVWIPEAGTPLVKIRSNRIELAGVMDAFEPAITSLASLRDELAKRAVQTFKDVLAEEYSDAPASVQGEYQYIHAIEDVDEILAEEEFKTKLEDMGWLERKQ